MTIEHTNKDRASVTLTAGEVRLLNNALNEVCNGINFDDGEFQTRLGVNRTAARALLKRLGLLLTELGEP